MLHHLLYRDTTVLQAYLNICCHINSLLALNCNSAFKKHNELLMRKKRNDVNNAANVKKKPLSFVHGSAFVVIFYNLVICNYVSSNFDLKTIKSYFQA